jgi:nicotinate-nucleotide pyrophosphorylase (carboxylating)
MSVHDVAKAQSLNAAHEPELSRLIDKAIIERVVATALEEDAAQTDITTLWSVSADDRTQANLISKEAGTIAGRQLLHAVFAALDSRIEVETVVFDGQAAEAGQVIARISGETRPILSGERAALNFMQRMSGIATLTARYLAAVAGTGVKIYDTRKTVPGLRALDKYAVLAGGGTNHRGDLAAMVLLKENHIRAAGGITAAITRVRQGMQESDLEKKIDVEVETLAQFEEALGAGVDMIMLDNMTLEEMQAAVKLARSATLAPLLEASGNITLERVRSVAETGVDLISIGSLTHSPRALDLSLLFV